MIVLKSPEEIEQIRIAGTIVADCHQELARIIRPGVTTMEIDRFVERYFASRGAAAGQKGYYGYPYATCASVNDVVCHGFPKDEPLKEGDLVTIDMVAGWNGWLADSAWSYPVGRVSRSAQQLLRTAEQCLYLGIGKAVVGSRIGEIAHTIQSYARSKGYQIVKEFCGHGIGEWIHEDPKIPHFGPRRSGVRLREGMVITIEPILTTGQSGVFIEEDGWTARAKDGSLSAQYEHTIAITKQGPRILTGHGR